MKKSLNKIHNLDSRHIDKILTGMFVDVTVTSPPYFDLKDYGHKDQIGFGQNYETYLDDLVQVFEQVYKITKDTGSLWVIIDSFKKDGVVYPLPFDFADRIKKTGWKLQDIIVWSKERTVPWAHKGQMRNLFEYVLVFSKTDKFKYYMDRIRDYDDLKKWWVKYPERYNPYGKNPSGIWKFDIPTQGSWGNGYVKHFCPLPEELVQRIIKLTTDEKDTVFDPFAGSGTVPAQAFFLNRNYTGFELNKNYINLFESYLNKNGKSKKQEYLKSKSATHNQMRFKNLILDLRSLKYASVLLKKVRQDGLDCIEKIFIHKAEDSKKKNSVIKVKYDILLKKGYKLSQTTKKIMQFLLVPPLSKFGIEADVRITTTIDKAFDLSNNGKLYGYDLNSAHKYGEILNSSDVVKSKYPLISKIQLNIDEKNY